MLCTNCSLPLASGPPQTCPRCYTVNREPEPDPRPALLLDKAVIGGLTDLAMAIDRDGELVLMKISAELDTDASSYPFLEKAEAKDDVVLELYKPPDHIMGIGQITEATASGFVWSGEAELDPEAPAEPDPSPESDSEPEIEIDDEPESE